MKSDVFSFGIILLEIISGKKNNGSYQEDHSMNLIGHVSNTSFAYKSTLCNHLYSSLFFSNDTVNYRFGCCGAKVES